MTEVRAFVGLSGYYRRFVQDFSVIASPLYELMKKGAEFEWTNECHEAFGELKHRLVTGPILAAGIVDTDATNTGMGAVLSQQQSGVEKYPAEH